jgi:hypothetical protein
MIAEGCSQRNPSDIASTGRNGRLEGQNNQSRVATLCSKVAKLAVKQN